jgi:hypothetical protein
MKKYSLHLLNVIFFISGFVSCKKETVLPVENMSVPPVIQNTAPVANAGPDIKIVLPQNSTVLQGAFYDADGNVKKVEWTKLSGPYYSTIVDKDSLKTVITNLREGIYEFELTVTDKRNLYGKDSVKVEVVQFDCNINRTPITAQVHSLGQVPKPNSYNNMFVAGNKLLITGESGYEPSSDLSIYDPTLNNFTNTKMGEPRVGYTHAVMGNKIFFAGGFLSYIGPLDLGSETARVDIYDLVSNSWSVANLSEPRGMINSAVVGNKIFFAGGIKSNGSFSKRVDIYDMMSNTWSFTEFKGTPRVIEAAVTAQNKIFFIGGFTKWEDPTGFGYIGTSPTKTIDVFDYSTGAWSIENMDFSRSYFSAIAVNDKVYIAGGQTEYALSTDLEIININTLIHTHSCLSQPTVSGEVALKNDLIIFLTRKGLDIYNTRSGEWSVSSLPASILEYGQAKIASANNDLFVLDKNELYKLIL